MSLQRAAAGCGSLWRHGLARGFASQPTNDYAQVMKQAYEISQAPEATPAEVGYTSGAPGKFQNKDQKDVECN